MKFRTEINTEATAQWRYNQRFFALGSCFAQNVSKKLKQYLFNVSENPFGIVFNPMSLAKQLRVLSGETFQPNIYFENERYFSFDFHSSFSGIDKKEVEQNMQQSIELGKQDLAQSDVLVLTFGTAFYYMHQTEGLVNNCHKITNNQFTKQLASVEEMKDALLPIIKQWLIEKQRREVVVTVSPIRHWKDGAVENSRSKASLLLLCQALEQNLPSVTYFPSYEIMMDELRDYRFYAEDMLHPSQQAIDYIWQILCEQRFKEKDQLFKQIDKVRLGLNHKPFNPLSESHKTFLHNIEQQIEELKIQGLDVSSFLSTLQSKIKNP